ncbi:methyltransferase [Streptosporangium sp. G11]|uniref:methyltransferase n=1 Tax=Streptosporangium sp. G11 TaxID=3436926 RepID=UPI003EB9438F
MIADHVSARRSEIIQSLADSLKEATGRTLPVQEAARRCDVIPGLMHQLLLPLAAAGIVTLSPTDHVTLTELGAALHRDVPGPMWDVVIQGAGLASWQATSQLAEVVRSGQLSLPGGQRSLYGYVKTLPTPEAVRFQLVALALAAEDLSRTHTVVDVGGGSDTMLETILMAHPHLGGALLDLPHVAERTKATLARRGMADRFRVLGVDFFEDVPVVPVRPGKVVYLAADILPHWSDEHALRLLTRIHNAMTGTPGSSELWCVARLMSDAHEEVRTLGSFEDVHKRTANEYALLLEKARLVPQRIKSLPSGVHLIIATV